MDERPVKQNSDLPLDSDPFFLLCLNNLHEEEIEGGRESERAKESRYLGPRRWRVGPILNAASSGLSLLPPLAPNSAAHLPPAFSLRAAAPFPPLPPGFHAALPAASISAAPWAAGSGHSGSARRHAWRPWRTRGSRTREATSLPRVGVMRRKRLSIQGCRRRSVWRRSARSFPSIAG